MVMRSIRTRFVLSNGKSQNGNLLLQKVDKEGNVLWNMYTLKGVNKSIIVVATGPFQFAMINPVITKKSGEYKTEEGCLSLDGVRPCIRYDEIEVDYLDSNFKLQHGKYSGFTAQVIQHEIDHCCGVVI